MSSPYKSKRIRLRIVEYTPETTTVTFTGTITHHNYLTRTFTVPATTAARVWATVDIPAGLDFDLSMWDSLGNRTGGFWTNPFDPNEREDIPHSDYSGWLVTPDEWISVDYPTSSGTWTIGLYAYWGTGVYTINVSTTPSVHVLGLVDLANIELLRRGNVEAKYGFSNRHKIGMKLARFTIQRWYKTDTGQTSLLYDLYENSTEFRLEEIIYNYRMITGAANDIVGERATGEAELWESKTYTPTFPLRLPVVW